MKILLLFIILAQIWNPMAGYWTEYQAVKSRYCNVFTDECYVTVKTDLWGKSTARIDVVGWIHPHLWPGRYCRFGGKMFNRYTRAQCRFPWVDTYDYISR